jgi:hypothetical protein
MTIGGDPYQPPQASLDGATVSPSGPEAASDAVVKLLAQTRPWVRRMAIFAFVGIGLFVLLIVVMGTLGERLGAGKVAASAFIPLLAVMLFYVPPALFLWGYASSIKQLQTGGGQTALENALRSQKSFWKYVGIFSTVIMVLYAIGLAVAVTSGAFFKH